MVKVVAAVIINEENKILITKRNLKKDQGGLWEFPGGKIEAGETEQEALKREIKEELDIEIEVEKRIGNKVHKYTEKEIDLIAYKAKKVNGNLQLLEHEDYHWIDKKEMEQFRFAEADKFIVKYLEGEK